MVFPCISVCQVPREMLKTEAEGDIENRSRLGFQHLPRGLANVDVLEKNVLSLLLHKFNDLFVKSWETIWHYILSPFGRQRASVHFFKYPSSWSERIKRLKWLPSFDSTSMFRK